MHKNIKLHYESDLLKLSEYFKKCEEPQVDTQYLIYLLSNRPAYFLDILNYSYETKNDYKVCQLLNSLIKLNIGEDNLTELKDVFSTIYKIIENCIISNDIKKLNDNSLLLYSFKKIYELDRSLDYYGSLNALATDSICKSIEDDNVETFFQFFDIFSNHLSTISYNKITKVFRDLYLRLNIESSLIKSLLNYNIFTGHFLASKLSETMVMNDDFDIEFTNLLLKFDKEEIGEKIISTALNLKKYSVLQEMLSIKCRLNIVEDEISISFCCAIVIGLIESKDNTFRFFLNDLSLINEIDKSVICFAMLNNDLVSDIKLLSIDQNSDLFYESLLKMIYYYYKPNIELSADDILINFTNHIYKNISVGEMKIAINISEDYEGVIQKIKCYEMYNKAQKELISKAINKDVTKI